MPTHGQEKAFHIHIHLGSVRWWLVSPYPAAAGCRCAPSSALAPAGHRAGCACGTPAARAGCPAPGTLWRFSSPCLPAGAPAHVQDSCIWRLTRVHILPAHCLQFAFRLTIREVKSLCWMIWTRYLVQRTLVHLLAPRVHLHLPGVYEGTHVFVRPGIWRHCTILLSEGIVRQGFLPCSARPCSSFGARRTSPIFILFDDTGSEE